MPQLVPFISQIAIARMVSRLAGEIQTAVGPSPLTAIMLLDGACFFAVDLVRQLALPDLVLRSMRAESYHGRTQSSGEVRIEHLPDLPHRQVLLIDDILDTGRTLLAVKSALLVAGVKEVKTCVLLSKPSRRVVPFEADFIGCTIPDRFVVGYGMDWQGKYRHLPEIMELLP